MWKCISLYFYFMVGFLWSLYLHTIFLWCSEKQTTNNKHLLELIKRRSKVKKKICHVNVLYILTNKKHFPKAISQWEFDYGPLTNLPRIIVVCDFSPSSLKLKRGILPPLIEKYPNLKTTRHINPNFFLWTRLLENLLFAKYLLSVAQASKKDTNKCQMTFYF